MKEKSPKVVFLVETLLVAPKMDRTRRTLGCECCFTVEPLGGSGGLAMLWNEDSGLTIHNYSLSHKSGWFSVPGQLEKVLVTGFYGDPRPIEEVFLGIC